MVRHVELNMATKKNARKPLEPTLRHVWLAGLGLIVVGRREALAAVADATQRFDAARQQAATFASTTQRDVLDRLADAREQGEARVGQFSADVEARLEPVLVKLGLKKKPARKASRSRKAAPVRAKTVRKPAPRKPAARRTRRA
ncbi:hypothetical protein C0063_06265 [Pseudoxanthomonas sp. KAs_5_3]|nr:hypothetical protein C0063_06265 [Pseudoxanthomonas sp. KAs_5_3]SFV26176.1 hypothetical protein SAMN05428990_0170 [Pseudoxanthomonas sp. YR558]